MGIGMQVHSAALGYRLTKDTIQDREKYLHNSAKTRQYVDKVTESQGEHM